MLIWGSDTQCQWFNVKDILNKYDVQFFVKNKLSCEVSERRLRDTMFSIVSHNVDRQEVKYNIITGHLTRCHKTICYT